MTAVTESTGATAPAPTAGALALARRAAARAAHTVPDTSRTTASAVLKLVPSARTSAPRAPFITLVVLLLAGGLLGLLALNTTLAEGSFRLHHLTVEAKELADREQELAREVETLRTPRNLAERARQLGMVPASSPAFLRLPDGAVLGAEVPAPEPGVPAP